MEVWSLAGFPVQEGEDVRCGAPANLSSWASLRTRDWSSERWAEGGDGLCEVMEQLE